MLCTNSWAKLREGGEEAYLLGSEPVAIIGSACRLPGEIDSPADLWELLVAGGDAISEVPAERWNRDAYFDDDPAAAGKINTVHGGFLHDVDEFDPQAFGIAPSEARYMDPQHRLLLEVAWEAFDDSGNPLHTMRGSKTGVFFGACNSDYGRMQLNHAGDISAHTLSGTAPSIAAGRLSYLFDLRGPSMIIDTACSSSLVAVHTAVQSLRNRDADVAVAGGVSLNLMPEETISLAKWGMLSPDGRCKTFDERANGFVRSEGCGVVVLKRLSDALRDQDTVRAVIRGSAINQDGRSNVLTAPNGEAQRQVISAAMAQAGITGRDVSFVETHGTGTKVGDPIEVESLVATVGQRREHGDTCYLGALKANLGHLEAAAGVAALIKVVLCLEHGGIPPQVHFRRLNPLVSLDGSCLRIPEALVPWEARDRPRVAGVSSFGFSGTNVHVVLEEAPGIPAAVPQAALETMPPVIIPVSAKHAAGVTQLAGQYADILAQDLLRSDTDDLAFTAAKRRPHFDFRSAAVGVDSDGLRQSFARIAAAPEPRKAAQPAIGFVFSGQGCNWHGMARTLMQREPVFEKALRECDSALDALAGWSIVDELWAGSGESKLGHTAYFQPVLFAIQVGLVALWDSWGIRPTAVAGHSVGEIAAAHTAGMLSLPDALSVVELRARLMQESAGQGAMAAVGLPAGEVLHRLRGEADLALAASNGPESATISGDPGAVTRFLARLDEEQVFNRRLDVDCAFHSARMEPYIGPLVAGLAGLDANAGDKTLFSTVYGAAVAPDVGDKAQLMTADYWGRNLREPVLFSEAVSGMIQSGINTFVEIGPHAVLSAYVAEIASHADVDCPVIASMRRDQDCSLVMREALASLYLNGCDPDWGQVSPRGRVTSLPAYPWHRERCWLDWEQRAQPTRRDDAATIAHPLHPLLGRRVDSPAVPQAIFENILCADDPDFLADHRIGGVCVLPAAAMIEMMISAGTILGARGAVDSSRPDNAKIRQFSAENALIIPDESCVRVQLVVSDLERGKRMEIYSQPADACENWLLNASGEWHAGDASRLPSRDAEDIAFDDVAAQPVDVDAFYARGRDAGIDFGAAFRSLGEIRVAPGRALARVAGRADGMQDSYSLHPVLLDACLQTVDAAVRQGDTAAMLLLPIAVDQIDVVSPWREDVIAVAELESPEAPLDENSIIDASVRVVDHAGELLASLKRVRMKVCGPSVLRRFRQELAAFDSDQNGEDRLAYDINWRAEPLAEAVQQGERNSALVVCTNEAEYCDALVTSWRERNPFRPTYVLCPSSTAGDFEAETHLVDPFSANTFDSAVREICETSGRVLPADDLDIVFLWDHTQATRAADSGVADQESLAAAFHLLQSLATNASRGQKRVLIASRQANALRDDEDCNHDQAALWGLAATLQFEHPDLHCGVLDLDAECKLSADTHSILAELRADTGGENRIAVRHGLRHVARLEPRDTKSEGDAPVRSAFRICSPGTGVFDDLEESELRRRAPAEGEVEIETVALGINFRDVLNVLNEVEGADGANLGAECAGRIVAVGEGVDDFCVGDRVIAFALGGFASHVTVSTELVSRVPQGLDSVAAAGVPVVFLTAKYALQHVAGLQPGQSVLIHSAAGGVGLAAVQVAQNVGATIFATAGSNEKRNLLGRLGVAHVFDSRNTGFTDSILAATDGGGVDVVLNSLSGEFIPASLAVVAPGGGCFVELGKRDEWTSTTVAAQYPGVRYRRIDLGDIAVDEPAVISALFSEIAAEFAAGRLQVLPTTLYPVEQIANAFRYMAQGRHIGKIVASVAPQQQPSGPVVRPDAAYLVTGGLGALGLQVAERLVDEGARKVVLVGRSPASDEAAGRIKAMRAVGTEVIVECADVAEFDAMSTVIDHVDAGQHELRGVIHCAGVLRDAAFSRQTWEGFRETLRPKVHGGWNLHLLTQDRELDFFVLFSSAAALLGWPGQSNYAAGNAGLDALAHYRRARGLAALSINWGVWAEAGMAHRVRNRRDDVFASQGLLSQDAAEALDALVDLLGSSASQLMVGRFDGKRFARRYQPREAPRFFDEVLAIDDEVPLLSQPVPETERRNIVDELEHIPPAQKLRVLGKFVEQQASVVLGLASGRQVDRKVSLNEQGLDSLLAVELRNVLAASLARNLPASLLFDYPSIDALTRHLGDDVLELQLENDQGPPSAHFSGATAGDSGADIVTMSDEEAEAQLLQELANLREAGSGRS
jgi:acyl transferase domain-containing protein